MQNKKNFRLSKFTRGGKSFINDISIKNEMEINSQQKLSSHIDEKENPDFRKLLLAELTKHTSNKDKIFSIIENKEAHQITLIYLLKKFPNFISFLKYHKIDENTLRNAVSFMKILKVKKGQYIFKQGDQSERMFGIIQGKVSLVEYNTEIGIDTAWGNNGDNFLELFKISEDPSKILFLNSSRRVFRSTNILEGGAKDNSFLSTNFYQKLQEKILNGVGKRKELMEGMCFGELDLINRRKRSCTAYALEDSDLFIIDKENFESTLYKAISKAESERVVFMFNMIPIFNNLPKKKFDEFFQQAVEFVIYKENEIIYEDGDKSEFIYFIYQGECCLKRDISKPYIFDINFAKEKEKEMDGKQCILTNSGEDKLSENKPRTVFNFPNSKISILNTNSHFNTIDYSAEKNRATHKNIQKASVNKSSSRPNNNHNTNNQPRRYFTNSNKNIETILKFNSGDASALECSADLNYLNHTMVSASSFTVLAKIDLSKITDLKKRIFHYFLPIYIEKEKIIENFVKSHRNVKFKIRLQFSGRKNLQELTEKISHNSKIDKQLQKDVEIEFEEKVRTMIHDVQKKKRAESVTYRKDSKFFTIEKIEENIFRQTLAKKNLNFDKQQNGLNFNITNYQQVANNISKLEVSDIFVKRQQRRKKTSNLKEISRNCSISNNSKRIGNDPDKEKDNSRINISKSPYKIFDSTFNSISNFGEKNLNSPYEIMKCYKLSKNINFRKDNVKNLKLNKPKIDKINSAAHKKQLSYNTGTFDIPLISFNMENYQSNNERILKLRREIHNNNSRNLNNNSYSANKNNKEFSHSERN